MSEKTTQNQRLDYLAEEFKTDSDEYKDLQTPAGTDGKRCILRSLTNIRMPRRMDEVALRIQDEYLEERVRGNGIVKLADIPMIRDGISVWQGGITRLAADAIVNVANSQMLGCLIPMYTYTGNCIRILASVQLRAEYERQMNQLRERYDGDYEQPTAVSVLADVYNLPTKKVVHTVGLIARYELTPKLEQNPADCYRNILNMCADHNLVNVTPCCISTNVSHFPSGRAAETVVQTVSRWVREHPGCVERIVFNAFQDEGKKYHEELV